MDEHLDERKRVSDSRSSSGSVNEEVSKWIESDALSELKEALPRVSASLARDLRDRVGGRTSHLRYRTRTEFHFTRHGSLHDRWSRAVSRGRRQYGPKIRG